jgi:hypothetical protein
MDTNVRSNKKTAVSARCARRTWKWNKRNRPQFGPVDHYLAEPKPIVVDRRAMLYGR